LHAFAKNFDANTAGRSSKARISPSQVFQWPLWVVASRLGENVVVTLFVQSLEAGTLPFLESSRVGFPSSICLDFEEPVFVCMHVLAPMMGVRR
jgi:hypothetical protein